MSTNKNRVDLHPYGKYGTDLSYHVFLLDNKKKIMEELNEIPSKKVKTNTIEALSSDTSIAIESNLSVTDIEASNITNKENEDLNITTSGTKYIRFSGGNGVTVDGELSFINGGKLRTQEIEGWPTNLAITVPSAFSVTATTSQFNSNVIVPTGKTLTANTISATSTGQMLALAGNGTAAVNLTNGFRINGGTHCNNFSVNAWTPTVGSATSGWFSTVVAAGRYYRIGNFITFMVSVAWSNKGDALAGDQLVITLPLTVNGNWRRAAYSIGHTSGVSYTGTLGAMSNTTETVIKMVQVTEGGAASAITCGGAGTSGEIQVSGSYECS